MKINLTNNFCCPCAGCLTAQRNDAAPLRIFAIKELSATDDFKHDRLIGTGAFGSVYKGLVKDNRRPGTLVVAIKRFHRNFDGQPSKEVISQKKNSYVSRNDTVLGSIR